MKSMSAIVALSLCLIGASAALAQDARLQEAQKILLLLNLDSEKPSGLPTPRSTQALREFQRTHNLPSTGEVDDQTLEALRTVRDTSIGHSLMMPPAQTVEQRRKSAEPPAHPLAQPTEGVDSQSLSGTQSVPDFHSGGAGSADLPPAISKRFTSNSPLLGQTPNDDGEGQPPAPPPQEAYWQFGVPIWLLGIMGAWTLLVAWGVISRLTAPLGRRLPFDDPTPATPPNRRDPSFESSR